MRERLFATSQLLGLNFVAKPNISPFSYFSRRKEDRVVYEVTKNKRFIEEYYALRHDCYRKELKLSAFNGKEDEYDRYGHIIIAQKGNELIGGSRIIMSNDHKLPLEEDGFHLTSVFPELKETLYCEFSRLALKEGYRNRLYLIDMVNFMIQYSASQGCQYAFAISPYIQARNYRIIFKKLGLYYKIFEDIKVPTKETYKHLNSEGIYLSVGAMTQKSKILKK